MVLNCITHLDDSITAEKVLESLYEHFSYLANEKNKLTKRDLEANGFEFWKKMLKEYPPRSYI
jgi:S-adenosylmethionine:diacylglycerol 3-amino-3-carboxypropyl transferase